MIRHWPRTWALLNYDKPHRCPAWSGPAWRGPKDGEYPDCENGSIPIWAYHEDHPISWRYRTFQCSECGTKTLPHVLVIASGYYWKAIIWRRLGWRLTIAGWSLRRTLRRTLRHAVSRAGRARGEEN